MIACCSFSSPTVRFSMNQLASLHLSCYMGEGLEGPLTS